MIKIPQQEWYHFRKGSKILNKNGTISEKGQKSSTKMVPFQKRVKIPQQNGTILEKGKNSSTKNGTPTVAKPFHKQVYDKVTTIRLQ